MQHLSPPPAAKQDKRQLFRVLHTTGQRASPLQEAQYARYKETHV